MKVPPSDERSRDVAQALDRALTSITASCEAVLHEDVLPARTRTEIERIATAAESASEMARQLFGGEGPAAESPAVTSKPAAGPPVPADGAKTVLVVEDQNQVRHLVCAVMEQQGFVVLRAASGKEAVEVCGGHPGDIDLVVCDATLPGMNGPALVETLREKRAGLRALFMSGHSAANLVSQGLLGHDTPLLEKPFSVSTLQESVRNALDRAAAPDST